MADVASSVSSALISTLVDCFGFIQDKPEENDNYKKGVKDFIEWAIKNHDLEFSPVVHAHWVKNYGGMTLKLINPTNARCYCSNCEQLVHMGSYCLYCGARMDESTA